MSGHSSNIIAGPKLNLMPFDNVQCYQSTVRNMYEHVFSLSFSFQGVAGPRGAVGIPGVKGESV